jgi:hypothetical protein
MHSISNSQAKGLTTWSCKRHKQDKKFTTKQLMWPTKHICGKYFISGYSVATDKLYAYWKHNFNTPTQFHNKRDRHINTPWQIS